MTFPRCPIRVAAALAAVVLLACGEAQPLLVPEGSEIPLPLSPTDGAIVDTPTPTLVVLNGVGFDIGATYDFEILAASGDTVVARIRGVAATPDQTSARADTPLERGFRYRWKAVAHGNGRDVESTLAAFEVGLPCQDTGDPWAKDVLALDLNECTWARNRASLLDPRSILGPPDARGTVEGNYGNFLSLGDGGSVTVDMGACVEDHAGPDLRVYQYIEHEPVSVEVAASPAGPWFELGTKRCGDGGLTTRSNHCNFDLADAGMSAARYVRVTDAERFPCEEAGTRSEGADVDAVEILFLRR